VVTGVHLPRRSKSNSTRQLCAQTIAALDRWNFSHVKLVWAGNFDELVEKKIRVVRVLDIIYYWFNSLPLFQAAQPALAQDDQPRMWSDAQKFYKIACVGCNHAKS